MNRAYLHLEPDAIWVSGNGNTWAKAANVTTAEGTYYTWQFEVNQMAGTVNIFRRVSDQAAWTTVALNVVLRAQEILDQWVMFPIFYNGANSKIQGIVVVDYLQIGVPGIGGGYDLWMESFGLAGADTLRTADVEPDGVVNLIEYALGGDPTVDDAAATLPTAETISEGGTNWLEYVYNRRKDYVIRNLEYNVETTTNLVANTWTNDHYSVSGIGSIDDNFEAVTNRVDTDLEGSSFLRLLIQEN